MESNPACPVYEGKTWTERENIKGKICVSCCPFRLIRVTFFFFFLKTNVSPYQTFIFSPADFEFSGRENSGGKRFADKPCILKYCINHS